jgi:multimeric flavodoxin WrbA
MQALTNWNAKITSTRTAVGQFKGQFKAMERYTWVRFAGKLTNCHNAHSKGQHSSGRWMKCHRRFKMQALTHWDAKITSTRTAVGQFKGQFKGAMERYMGSIWRENSLRTATTHRQQ